MKLHTSSLPRLKTFEEMPIAAPLKTALKKMAVNKPTEVQMQAIPVGLEGADLIAVAQTGSGKTLAFALSLLTRLEQNPEARGLVLAPSREMAQQIYKIFVELCAELPITTVLAIGGVPGKKQTSQLKKIPRLIIGTPGRLNDHLQTNKLLLQGVEVIVIDEADRMLDMGFAPQLKHIKSTLRGNPQTMMFAASFGENVESIAEVFMRDQVVMIRTAQAEEPVATLNQKVLFLDRDMKNDRLLDELNATKGGVIVFTGNQESCEAVGQYLKDYGFSTDLIHGGQSQGQRNRVVREFRQGEIRIVVATDLLARGLDVPHVEYVVNFDLPFQAEDYLHRIGRTARAGRGGNAITFVTPSDNKMYHKIKPYLQGAKDVIVDKDFKFIDRSIKHEKKRLEREGKSPTKSAKPERRDPSARKPLSTEGKHRGSRPDRPERNDKYADEKKSFSRPTQGDRPSRADRPTRGGDRPSSGSTRPDRTAARPARFDKSGDRPVRSMSERTERPTRSMSERAERPTRAPSFDRAARVASDRDNKFEPRKKSFGTDRPEKRDENRRKPVAAAKFEPKKSGKFNAGATVKPKKWNEQKSIFTKGKKSSGPSWDY
ncbi:MAG: DEAD/DEAH box helicase [Bdellovibrionota bacterium]